MKSIKFLFASGASLIFIVALVHFYIAFAGGELYIYFGAGQEMYDLDISGSNIPMITTLALTLFFVIMGLYGLSAVKVISPLPKQELIVKIITGIFLLRGLSLFYELYLLFAAPQEETLRFFIFSIYAFTIGSLYLLGIIKLKKEKALTANT